MNTRENRLSMTAIVAAIWAVGAVLVFVISTALGAHHRWPGVILALALGVINTALTYRRCSR